MDSNLHKADEWVFKPQIMGVETRAHDGEHFKTVILDTERGEVELKLYSAGGSRRAVLMVGGTGGGFDTPARGLYPKLSEQLSDEGVNCLRVRFRISNDLGEAVHDVVAALEFLKRYGINEVALIGHSFGGSVVIMAGVLRPEVKGVVTLATQAFGTNSVNKLAPRPLLLIHGNEDEVLSPTCSNLVYQSAHEPKTLILLDHTRHNLDEVADRVFSIATDWLKHMCFAEPADKASSG